MLLRWQERVGVLPSELLEAAADLPRGELKKRAQRFNGMIDISKVKHIPLPVYEPRQVTRDE